MESLFTSLLLFGGAIFWTWAVLIAFVIVCFIADLSEKGYVAFIAFLALGGLYYWQGDFKAFLHIFTWGTVVGYIAIGFIYSLCRTYIAGRKLGKKIKDLPTEATKKSGDYETREYAIKEYISEELAGNVFRWWFLWVISLIDWIVGDFLKDVWDIIWKFLKNLYKDLLNWGIKSVLGEK